MTDQHVPYQHSIVVTGGTVTGAMAAGQGASATYHAPAAGSADLEAAVEELRALLDRHRASVEDAEQVLRDTAELLAARREPDRVRAILQRIAGRGTALAAVLEIVAKTQDLVGRIVH